MKIEEWSPMKRHRTIRRRVALSAFGLLILPIFVQAETKSKVGTTVYPFLEIGVGARAAGLGEAYTARASNATGLYWNPAGIALGRNELTFDHTMWFASLQYNFVGLIVKMGSVGSIGLSLTSLYSGPIKVTTALRPEGTGQTYESSDIALGAAYARQLTDRFSLGGVIKYIHSSLWDMTTSAVAFDIGTMFNSPLLGLTMGMSISNFGSSVSYSGANTIVRHDIDPIHSGNNDKILGNLRTNEWELPLIFRFGIAREFGFGNAGSIICSVDALHPNNNAESLNMGIEYAFRRMLFLRAGYKAYGIQDSEEGLTFGGGFGYRILKVDYSYSDFGLLDNIQRFSFSLVF